MSQNRQDTKDRSAASSITTSIAAAESEIQGLAHKLNLLGDKIGDVEDLIRERLTGGGGGDLRHAATVRESFRGGGGCDFVCGGVSQTGRAGSGGMSVGPPFSVLEREGD